MDSTEEEDSKKDRHLSGNLVMGTDGVTTHDPTSSTSLVGLLLCVSNVG